MAITLVEGFSRKRKIKRNFQRGTTLLIFGGL